MGPSEEPSAAPGPRSHSVGQLPLEPLGQAVVGRDLSVGADDGTESPHQGEGHGVSSALEST